MEILLLAVVLVLVLVLRANISDNNNLIKILKRSVDDLQDEVRHLNKRLTDEGSSEAEHKPLPKVSPAPEPLTPKPFPAVPKESGYEPVIEKAAIEEPSTLVIQPPAYVPASTEQPAYRESWFEKWLKNNPDMEKFIGENLINKIGIAVLVLGIAFFVKYAIDQNWINEQGRVGIGLLCGGILIGLAHRLRNSYRSFSSVLVGGGLTVFYFTIAIAFHEYKLLGQTTAFVCMAVITAFAVILSLIYNRVELAILATIGGFATPFLLTTGNENYVALFTYLAVLNVGLIVLGYYKQWRILNFISLFFTVIIYGTWLGKHAIEHSIPYYNAFAFATIFYLLFLAMNLISQFSVKDKLKAFDLGILLTVNVVYFSAGMIIFTQAGLLQYKGFFTASLGVLNLVLAYSLFKSKSLDRNFIYLLIGLTISYISLTAPVQLKGNYITLFWAAEAVLLLWLYQHSFIRLIKIASLLVSICMAISLLIDWAQVYSLHESNLLPVVINRGFITTMVAVIAMSLLSGLMKKEADTFYVSGVTNAFVKRTYAFAAVILLLIAGSLEINYQFIKRYPSTGLHFVYLQLYIVSFFTLLFMVSEKWKWQIDDYLRSMITTVVFLLYLVNASTIYRIETDILVSGINTIHLMANIFNVIAITSFLLYAFFFIVKNRERYRSQFTALVTTLALAFVTMLSIEIRNAYIWSTYNNPASIDYFENLYAKALLTIIWGLSSFAMIWLGMRYRFKSLRITALLLFGITLVKLFSFDIQNIPPAGKIAAFILLGILLLVVSFMYQRLKKLIIDNGEAE